MYPSYNAMPMPGYAMPNRPQPKCTQPVTAEMSKMIFSQEDDLSTKISPIEKIKNQCTHKYPGSGQIALVEGSDGKVSCRVCGESFHMILDPTAEIATTTEKMRDILQSIKTMYLDIPENFAKEYFQLITLLERAPALFEKACKNFQQYDQYSANPMQVGYGVNSFQQVNGMIGGYNMGGIAPQPPMYGGMPYYPQPQPGYNMQQPPQAQPAQPNQSWPVNQYSQPIPPQPAPGYYQQPPQQYNGYDPNMGGNPLMYAPPTASPEVTGPAPSAGMAPNEGEITQTKAFTV